MNHMVNSGIKVILTVNFTPFEKTSGGTKVRLTDTHFILIRSKCIGRSPNTEGLFGPGSPQ